jgi:hypothetical protein
LVEKSIASFKNGNKTPLKEIDTDGSNPKWRRPEREKREIGEEERGRRREREREDAECGGLFCILMPWWHATSALGARVACLGPEMDPFKRFRDPNMHFESLGTQLAQ